MSDECDKCCDCNDYIYYGFKLHEDGIHLRIDEQEQLNLNLMSYLP
jgi:hypothetical protein